MNRNDSLDTRPHDLEVTEGPGRSASSVTRWALHTAGPAPGTHQVDGPHVPMDPSLPDIHGWLELHEDHVIGTTLRLAGLLPGPWDQDEDLARHHFRFQGSVTGLVDEGILVAKGQLRKGDRIEEGVARLRLGRFQVRDGSEWLDVHFHLSSEDSFSGSGLSVSLTGVRPRSAS